MDNMKEFMAGYITFNKTEVEDLYNSLQKVIEFDDVWQLEDLACNLYKCLEDYMRYSRILEGVEDDEEILGAKNVTTVLCNVTYEQLQAVCNATFKMLLMHLVAKGKMTTEKAFSYYGIS